MVSVASVAASDARTRGQYLLGDFWDSSWQQTYQVNPSFSEMCHSQNYVNNENLPGKSAVTQQFKVCNF